ncbi:MAG: DHHW family protein [Bacteroides sp.]|nr:DHHW family protein [Eubacterium sp.]MCM1418509.1 DHHW family protein [Roseburia sp.]MCM1462528.1 DHHW family protein [Bacteroides sp.]
MRKYRFSLLFTALLFAACGCSSGASASDAPVTFRTVRTEGISAYTTVFASETAETQAPPVSPVSAVSAVSKITRHYETTIPETLVGGFSEAPKTTEVEGGSRGSAPSQKETTTKAATDAVTANTPDLGYTPEYAEIGGDGILVIRRSDGHYLGLMPCWGTYSLCESWAASVNELKRCLPDVNVYHAVIPTSSEFYVPDGFSGFTASQKNKIDHVAERLEDVANVDMYSAVAAHTAEAIYARTDHHWLPLGAYYAAEAFAAVADVPFPPLSDYAAVEADGYVGSLYGYSKDAHLRDDPEVFTLYLPPNKAALATEYYDRAFANGYASELFPAPDGSAYYCSFLGSDDRIARIATDVNNGRKLVIFKESYGNALVPFLTSSFEEIYVCDIRYFDLNAAEFCSSVGATDVLAAVCTYTAAGTNGNYLKRILT